MVPRLIFFFFSHLVFSRSLSNMAPEYFLKNIYKNKIMNNTSVGFVSPSQSVFLQVMAPLYMAIWQLFLQNMADVGYHIIGTDTPHLDF